MDIVHSHSCSNVLDGLNVFDGTDHMSASPPPPPPPPATSPLRSKLSTGSRSPSLARGSKLLRLYSMCLLCWSF
jgi:hypothetical protein